MFHRIFFSRNDNSILLKYDYCNYSDFTLCFDVKKEYIPSARYIFQYLSGFTSPMSKVLIDEQRLAYEVYVDFDEYSEFAFFVINITPHYDKLCTAIVQLTTQLALAVNTYSEKTFDEAEKYYLLNNRKNELSPELYAENCFFPMFINNDDKLKNVSYQSVKNAIKDIFSKNNLSIMASYSCKKSDVINAINVSKDIIGQKNQTVFIAA